MCYNQDKAIVQPTKLLPVVCQILNKCADPTDLNYAKFTDNLQLIILNKNPCFFLTDKGSSIQALMPHQLNNRDQMQLDPFNKKNTNYYVQGKNSEMNLNCKDKYLARDKLSCGKQFKDSTGDPPSLAKFGPGLASLGLKPQTPIHPYLPEFYFRRQSAKYSQFLHKREHFKQDSFYQAIKITKWGLRVVNIGYSGYYGVVLVVWQYLSLCNTRLPDLRQISSVIYQSEVHHSLQRFRLNDIRNRFNFRPREPPECKISLCYYLRNSKTTLNKNNKNIQYISIDKQQEILKHKSTVKKANASSILNGGPSNLNNSLRVLKNLKAESFLDSGGQIADTEVISQINQMGETNHCKINYKSEGLQLKNDGKQSQQLVEIIASKQSVQKKTHLSYIIAGSISGLCFFKSPLNSSDIDLKKLQEINTLMMQSLFNAESIKKIRELVNQKKRQQKQLLVSETEKEDDDLWPDQDEMIEEQQANAQSQHLIDVDSQASSEEDPLRALYVKMLGSDGRNFNSI